MNQGDFDEHGVLEIRYHLREFLWVIRPLVNDQSHVQQIEFLEVAFGYRERGVLQSFFATLLPAIRIQLMTLGNEKGYVAAFGFLGDQSDSSFVKNRLVPKRWRNYPLVAEGSVVIGFEAHKVTLTPLGVVLVLRRIFETLANRETEFLTDSTASWETGMVTVLFSRERVLRILTYLPLWRRISLLMR